MFLAAPASFLLHSMLCVSYYWQKGRPLRKRAKSRGISCSLITWRCPDMSRPENKRGRQNLTTIAWEMLIKNLTRLKGRILLYFFLKEGENIGSFLLMCSLSPSSIRNKVFGCNYITSNCNYNVYKFRWALSIKLQLGMCKLVILKEDSLHGFRQNFLPINQGN